MEKIDEDATFRKKTSENAQSFGKCTVKHSTATSKDNVADYSAKQTVKIEQDCANVWVKPEIIWDQDEQSDNEHSSIYNGDADFESCHDDGESSTSNLYNDQSIDAVDPLSEYVMSDNEPSFNETNKIKLLEKQLELSNSRNLELEKIVHEQKYEIEQLRIQQKNCGYCSKVLEKKEKRNREVRTDPDFDENATICPVCKKDLTTIKRKSDRIRHLRGCRDGSKFKCPYCILTYTRKHDLMKHFKKCAIQK